MNTVTAVIPVHNRADLLAKLLASMKAQTVPFTRILVVDNASTDDAPAIARAAGCQVLPMGENTGFARAVNAGWKASPDEWIAILNSDVELAPAWLANLIGNAGNAAFATGLILDANRDRIDGTYDLISRACCAWRAGHGAPLSAETGAVRPIAIPPGTACLFRRHILEAFNGFDESFESYLEDVDLGLRLVRAGIPGVYVPSAKAWHRGSATFGRWDSRVVRLSSRNQLLLVARHFDVALARNWRWALIVGQLLWGLVALRHGAFLPWLAGKRDGLRNLRLSAEPSAALRRFIIESELEIAGRARDPYWRLYFLLTGFTRDSHRAKAAAL